MSLDITLYLDNKNVFDANITHNLSIMADECGLYRAMWRPEELNIKKAGDLIGYLKTGLKELIKNKDYYTGFNQKNGWGNHQDLVDITISYLSTCVEYKYAIVEVRR